jgi:hypothetical protein
MAWSDVTNRIKFFGPAADDLGNPTGLDGMPITINGLALYGQPFATLTEDGTTVPKEKADILSALADLYDHSATARALLNAGTSGEDIWLMKSTDGSASFFGTGTAKIDFNDVNTFSWMGSDGRFQQENLAAMSSTNSSMQYTDIGISEIQIPAK